MMGVVNLTPDSFYAGSRFPDADRAITAALDLAAAGAQILDIGAESTRPGASEVSELEELHRLRPVIEGLRRHTDLMISVDTRHAGVAERVLSWGVDIINDVSGLSDSHAEGHRLARAVAIHGAGLVLMHMKGTPRDMQREPHYDDVVSEVTGFLDQAGSRAIEAGVGTDSILIDPGIGFGKTVQHNLTLLNQLPVLAELGRPLLVGTSRKSFLGHILNKPPEERLLATAASVAVAILRGAHVVRVHDAREMADVVRVADAIRAENAALDTPVGAGRASQP